MNDTNRELKALIQSNLTRAFGPGKPPHSVVLGNPGVIHHKENATADYIKNQI